MADNAITLGILDYLIILGFISLIVGIGLYFSKRASASTNDFFLGGRSLPWFLAGISMVATSFAADTPLAVTELVRQGGVAGNWFWWNLMTGGMLTTFFFAKYWRRANILTDVELIKIRYSGREANFLRGFKAVYLGVFVNALIIGWVNLALMTLLKVFFGISPAQALFITLGAMFVVYVYSGFSGLLGVVYTDFVQFIIAMSGCIVLAIVVVTSDKIGGIDGLKGALPASAFRLFPSFRSDAGSASAAGVLSVGIGSFLAFLILPWWNSWYPGAEPGGGGYIVQRMMSTKDEKNAVYSVLLYQIVHYTLRPWPWIIVGLCAIVLYPDLQNAQMGYVLAMRDFLPAGLKGLLLAAFLAAYMSTVASQLNWGTSYLINDFVRPFIRPQATEKELVTYSRISVFVMIFVAFGVTSQITSISAVWNFLIQTGAGLGLVLILRWYWWRINAWSEIAGTIAPFIGYGIVRFILSKSDPSWAAPIIENPKGFIFTIVFTIIIWLIVTFKTNPTEDSKLEAFFNLVQPAGNWKPFRADNQTSSLWTLAAAWISAVIMAYSVLFATGSIIFKNWADAGLYVIVFVVSLLLMRYFSGKVNIFASIPSTKADR